MYAIQRRTIRGLTTYAVVQGPRTLANLGPDPSVPAAIERLGRVLAQRLRDRDRWPQQVDPRCERLCRHLARLDREIGDLAGRLETLRALYRAASARSGTTR